MTPMPLVSIIIASYNYERFLQAAIDSALAQTYPHVEVIVVDDGSSDKSPQIIAGYGSRIMPVLKEHEGEASAYNAGFARSHGEIVIFLDSDDELSPCIVQKVVTIFQSKPEISKVQYRMEIIDDHGNHLGDLKPASHLHMPSGDFRDDFLKVREYLYPPTSGNAFSANVLHTILPIPEMNQSVNTDYYLHSLSVLLGPIISLDHTGAYYRQHSSNTYNARQIDPCVIRRDILSFIHVHSLINELAQGMGVNVADIDVLDALSPYLIYKRIISYRIDRDNHPISGEDVTRLCAMGVRASLSHPFWSVHQRILNAIAFMAMVSSPRTFLLWLADRLYYPERRRGINRLISVLNGTTKSARSGNGDPHCDARAKHAMMNCCY